jgi:hypothetical protein
VKTGLVSLEKYLVKLLEIVFGKLCFSYNPQMLEAYKNKCVVLIDVTCTLRMDVSEMQGFPLWQRNKSQRVGED